MNIFLTGNIQVGKSTIINKFITSHPNIKVGGFKTVSNFDKSLGVYGGVYIGPASEDSFKFNEDCHVGNRVSGKKSFPHIFDIKGLEYLKIDDSYDLVIMDEIGFMETNAKKFSKAVLDVLDLDVPVIGVIKPIRKGLPLNVKMHEKTKLLEVTIDNRDHIYNKFKTILEKELDL